MAARSLIFCHRRSRVALTAFTCVETSSDCASQQVVSSRDLVDFGHFSPTRQNLHTLTNSDHTEGVKPSLRIPSSPFTFLPFSPARAQLLS
ncbi:hypothetical protein BJ165DRAFT_1120973 [Panaeolus papilionaceus]|nr:hypothetical protein BJ165DRAFT_1120973 [Panaeolus papilionaceus]